MALIYFTGFESATGTGEQGSSGTISFSTSVKKNGGYALRVNPTTTGTGLVACGQIAADGSHGFASAANLYTKFDFRVDTLPAANSEEFFRTQTSAGALKAMVRLNSTGTIAVYNASNALVQTSSGTLSTSTWYRIEVLIGTSATVGAYEVRVDGATVLSGTMNTTANNNGVAIFGKTANLNSQSVDFYYDDVVMDDAAFVGDVKVKPLYPIANGSTAGWTAGLGASDYTQVDEVGLNDGNTTYIQSTAAAATHLVTLQSTTTGGITPIVSCIGFKMQAVTREVSTGTSAHSVRVRSSATNSDSSTSNITTTYTHRQRVLAADPATGIAWVAAGLDAVEIGVVEANAIAMRCTQIFAQVAYSDATAATVRHLGILGVGV